MCLFCLPVQGHQKDPDHYWGFRFLTHTRTQSCFNRLSGVWLSLDRSGSWQCQQIWPRPVKFILVNTSCRASSLPRQPHNARIVICSQTRAVKSQSFILMPHGYVFFCGLGDGCARASCAKKHIARCRWGRVPWRPATYFHTRFRCLFITHPSGYQLKKEPTPKFPVQLLPYPTESPACKGSTNSGALNHRFHPDFETFARIHRAEIITKE